MRTAEKCDDVRLSHFRVTRDPAIGRERAKDILELD